VNIEAQTEGLQSHGGVGRKPKRESRAAEFRQRLIAWKQLPESLRPSLRALACELGTSHQLLAHYLDGLEEWLFKERYRRAKKQAREIRARAKAENREMTMRECIAATITPMVLGEIESIRQDAKRGSLDPDQIKTLKAYAKHLPEAQWVLQKYSHIKPEWKKVELTPEQQRMLASLPKDQARRYERWIQACAQGRGYNLCLDRQTRIIG
jgi:hypothetical protein